MPPRAALMYVTDKCRYENYTMDMLWNIVKLNAAADSTMPPRYSELHEITMREHENAVITKESVKARLLASKTSK